MVPMRRTHGVCLFAALAAVAACSAGCATFSSRRSSSAVAVFYPPPPSVPRVVYIADINDLTFASKSRGGLERFLFNRPSGSNDRIEKPFGLAASGDALYVCDTQRAVVHVFDLAAQKHGTLGASGAGRLLKPLAIALDDQGNRYVADVERGEVVVFDRNGEAVRALRPTEQAPFEPVDVALGDDGLFVLNRASRRVEVLNPLTGELVRTFPGSSWTYDGSDGASFGSLSGLAIDGKGLVYASDTLNCKVHKIDQEGIPLTALGRPGDRAGEFARPKHLAFGPDGILYVVDAAFQRVQMFDKSGRCLMLFGGGDGRPGSLTMPAGVAISRSLLPFLADRIPDGFSADYLIFVSDQFGPWGVRIYAFGRGRPASSEPARPDDRL